MAIRRRREFRQAGGEDPPQAHLRRIPAPDPVDAAVAGRFLEAWSALSIGLLVITLVAVLVLAPAFAVPVAVLVIAAFIFIESILQRRVVDLIVISTRVLAVIATLVFVMTFWQPILILARSPPGSS